MDDKDKKKTDTVNKIKTQFTTLNNYYKEKGENNPNLKKIDIVLEMIAKYDNNEKTFYDVSNAFLWYHEEINE